MKNKYNRRIPKYINNNKNIQSGGDRVIPSYMNKKNSPYKSKDINTQHYKNKNPEPPPNTDNDLISFKINKEMINNMVNTVPAYRQIYPSPYIPVKYPMPNTPYVSGVGTQPMYGPNNIPIINNYKIDTGGFNVDHSNLNQIYEDILPIEIRNSSFETIKDRMLLYTYLRATFINYADGENIDLNNPGLKGGSRKRKTFNILDRVKLMDFNPFNVNKFSANPYSNLPDRMLLYRSCYPLNLNISGRKLECSKNSLGINIRVYNMNVAELSAKKMTKTFDWHRFDLWREIGFYEYIKEKIIKRNVCPNFNVMYSYYIAQNNVIDFKKFNLVKKKNMNENEIKKQMIKQKDEENILMDAIKEELRLRGEESRLGFIYKVDKNKRPFKFGSFIYNQNNKDLAYITDIPYNDNTVFFYKMINFNSNVNDIRSIMWAELEVKWEVKQSDELRGLLLPNYNDTIIKNLDNYTKQLKEYEVYNILRRYSPLHPSGMCLISLTESYNYPLRLWASRIYERDLNVTNKMINTGFHSEKVWYSILFQLFVAMIVMYNEKICITKMDMDDNVFIKFVGREDSNNGYWKYIINNVEYFIPNYGYMVIIDTNYKDIPNNTDTVSRNGIYNLNRKKIYSPTIFPVDDGTTDEPTPETNDTVSYVDQCNLENFKTIFNNNNFDTSHMGYGGIPPPDKVKTILTNIQEDLASIIPPTNYSTNLEEILIKRFTLFLHNRIGTNVLKEEEEYINFGVPVANKKSGTVYATQDQKFALYVKYNDDSFNTVLNLDSVVSSNDEILFEFNSREPLVLNYKLVDQKFTTDNLLDTYKIFINNQ